MNIGSGGTTAFEIENPLGEERGPSSPSTGPMIGTTSREARAPARAPLVPRKTMCAAFGLFSLGLCLFGASLDFYIDHPNHEGSLPIFVLACLVMLPGMYSVTIVTGILRGWPGYHIDQLPMYHSV